MKNLPIRKAWHIILPALMVVAIFLVPQLGKSDPTRPVPFPWGNEVRPDWKYLNGSYFGQFEGRSVYFIFVSKPTINESGVYIKLFVMDAQNGVTMYKGQVFALRTSPSVTISLNGAKKVTLSQVQVDPYSKASTPWWFPADDKPHIITIIKSNPDSRTRAFETVTVLEKLL